VKNILLGVGITNATNQEVLEYILQGLKKGGEKYFITTPNPEILVYANKHPEFKSILNQSRLAIPDGSGVIWAGKILGKKFKERVTGTDLMENLCKLVSKQPITVGFLGGRDRIAEKTAECLTQKYPGLQVVFAAPEWNGEASVADENFLGPAIRLSSSENFISSLRSVDILFVAYGFPKQERWMSESISKLPVRVMMGVGGAFDYIGGDVPRAPKFVRSLGFEWLFRLVIQPWRLKRQLALIEFILLVLREKFSIKTSF